MRTRWLVLLLCLLCLAGAWFFWQHSAKTRTKLSALQAAAQPANPAVTAPNISTAAATNGATSAKTNPFAYRLSNTSKTLGQLVGNRHAILLENALIDTASPLNLAIPKNLRSQGDPGAYIVQAHGPIDNAFRAMLSAAGAQIVSYIPNDAYLVRAPAGVANGLASNPLTQAVIPYEPYYKLQPSLLGLAVEQKALPPGTALNLGLFTSDAAATEQQLEKLGAKIIGSDQSPFGPVLRVLPPTNWTALAQAPGVQRLELAHRRVTANDLARVTLGVAADPQVATNYLGLTGQNVMVAVNDTGIDATHPDFGTGGSLPVRVIGDPANLVDYNGHGTHVAGIIAGDGTESTTVTNAQGSIMPATNGQFRGKAPLATLFSMNNNHSDYVLQTTAALNNALISNNSWDYGNGDAEYDLAAASYDAATRDALPGVTGSQPVLFVFAAGNSGNGDDSGGGGGADTIFSPGTAKNVITVGALEQLRDITNVVTKVENDVTNTSTPWKLQTDSSLQVAAYSSRGNVGVGTEGAFGRFKPDVVAPGTFVVSTRSSQWDTNAYYNPTNVSTTDYKFQRVSTNALVYYYPVSVPPNAISVVITIKSNKFSRPFPADLPIYVKQSSYPTTNSYDFVTTKNGVSIPPDGGAGYLQQTLNSGFDFAVGDSTNVPVFYDVSVAISTTNNQGDYYQVLEGMNDTLGINGPTGPWYRYESGTSMAAADVSGVLALMEDYFTNQLQTMPSPALLKAMLINGSRPVGSYTFALTNGNNFQGWGRPYLPNTLPLTTSNLTTIGTNSPLFWTDQDPLTALATGDSHTYIVTLNTSDYAQYLQLQATLVWTDPPGDPAAALKLVNNLDLVITNLDTLEVYYGNDISPALGYNLSWDPNSPPNFDSINNVQNIILPPLLAGSYSVTVVGRAVNVNAVTAQTNNVVQDYALVIADGEGEVPDALTVTDNPIVSNPTSDQQITFVTSTNTPLMNQFVGANTPLLGTNTLPLGTNTIWGSAGQMTIGMTNQWHFYVVTNTGARADFTNAAFITFNPYTLSIPRMGVYEDTIDNATRPEADIDLYATTDPSLMNLNPVAVSNCLAGVDNGRASLGQGGTEFVYYTNSAPGQVYYVGVYSEDRMASEYAFLSVFTSTPFSQINNNGDLVVPAMYLPVNIPDGDNAHPGVTNVFALAIPLIPNMTVAKVTVNNLNEHQNFGDLFGVVAFGANYVVLNNHDGYGNTFGAALKVYDDSRNPVAGSQHTDGPGNLSNFRGKSAIGPWILTEMDNSLTMTGRVSAFNLVIQPHRDLPLTGAIVTIPPKGWFIDFVDVPPGYTNLTFYATNLPPTIGPPPLQMYEKLGDEPTLTDYDQEADLTNCVIGAYPTGTDPGNSISVGPPLNMGRYFVGLYNPGSTEATVFLSATLGISLLPSPTYNYTTNPATALLDDAVSLDPGITDPGIFVSATQAIASVNVGFVVKSPRISDLTFTLVSPTGQRILLMENRGAGTTNGAGAEFVYTNILNITATGGAKPDTNYLEVPPYGGAVPITYNFYTAPDEMTVYEGTNISPANLILDTGMTNNPWFGPGSEDTYPVTINVNVQPGYTNIIIIMNQFGNTNLDTAWIYTAGAAITNYGYLMFTDDSNLATVPIKYAEPPYNFTEAATNYVLCDFELATNGNYRAPTNIYDAFGGWTVPTNLVTYTTVVTNGHFVVVTNVVILTNNLVSVVTDPATSLGNNAGSNYLALANGTITRSISTIPGHIYNVTFWYRGPGIAGWWRGEGDASDSSDPEKNGNNGFLIGRFYFPDGEVGQAFDFDDAGAEFQFAGTNTYVQIPQNPSLDVGKGSGFTIEGWINPTNLARPQPLVEWLAHVPTNAAVTNIIIKAGPFLDPATGHYYYLLGSTNWTTSELWATRLGGHLATLDTANEDNWVYDTFAQYGGINRNLWIGLTNNPTTKTFIWSSGLTNVVYTNWVAGGPPAICPGGSFCTAILGPTNAFPGLWVLENNSGNNNNGVTCGVPPTNQFFGVVEVNDIQTNGVQFWISVTNSPGTTNSLVSSNGCLYANLVDITNGSHEIYSAPGLLLTNVYQHVALTYNTNSGLAMLYLNGTNVATTNLGVFVPKTDGDVLLGRDMSRWTNNYYGGTMDEMSIYRRALSGTEIAAIHQVSAFATNGLTGKFDPSVTPAYGLAEAQVSFGPATNVIFGVNNQWEMNSFTFTARSNSMPLQISGLEPGILLDQFAVSEAPLTNIYYLPEQSLEALTGTAAYGTWTLQIWDNRVGAYVTNLSELLSWQLQFILESNATVSASLDPQTPAASTVSPGQLVYYSVTVPMWAHYATNILVSSTLPVDLFFNQTNPPTGSNPNDWTLLANSTSGIGLPILATNGVPPAQLPLLTNQTYYLGVRNSGIHAASVVLEVDYDITALTNGVPYTSVLTTNADSDVRYFSFDVSSNAYEATFQLLQLSGNADLVVRKGPPLPTLTSTDYGGFNVSNLDENIYVFTNSSPVPLSAGRWYLGVLPRDSRPINYSILAKEFVPSATNTVTIIDLTNGVPFNFTAEPGAALTNFFRFSVTNNPSLTNAAGVRFELYDMTGNGDLTLQTNAPPYGPPFFQSSQEPGLTSELIYITTNSAQTNLGSTVLTNLAANWYLGVPNHEITNISFTILAVIDTNLPFAAFPGAEGAGGGSLGGRGSDVYHVVNLDDDGPGSLRYGITHFIGTGATNTPGTGTTNIAGVGITNLSGARTIVFDVSGTINLLSPLVITNSYLTIAGQTALGGGITVVGSVTTVQFAHDVVIRYLRFRPAGVVVIKPVLAWTNGFEGAAAGDYVQSNSFDGWTVVTNQVTVISNAALAYQGTNLLALADGVISRTLPTLVGQTYTLSYAYRGPGAVALWRGESNALDSIDGNNPTSVQYITFTNGEVRQAFHYDGSTSLITVPGNTSLEASNLTLDAWIFPTDTSIRPIIDCGGAGQMSSVQLWVNTTGFMTTIPGAIHGLIRNSSGGLDVICANSVVVLNRWNHLAFTVNTSTRTGVLYCNGVPVASNTVANPVNAQSYANVNIGYRAVGTLEIFGGYRFLGNLDEVSIYNRDLSASEIKAIYNHGSAGKYTTTTNAPSIAQGLAEAQVTLNGTPQPVFFGNNTNWQTTNITFTATQTNLLLQFSGIEPGMLLDAVSLTVNLKTNANSGDSLQLTNVVNVVADHISASWSTNNLVSVLNSTNVTVQWSIMADSLYNPTNRTGFGSALSSGSGALSFNHNLYADNYSANPYLDDNLSLDFVNNVIYNWGIRSGYSGTNNLPLKPNGFTNRLNYACNYLIAGPDTAIFSTNAAQTNFAFWGGTTNTWIFQTNNFMDSDTNRILNGANTEWGMFTNQYTRFGRPFPLTQVPTDEAFMAYEKVLDFAGASLCPRDPADMEIVTGVRTQTGRIISTPPLSGLIGWWPGNGNANDIVGGNNGIPQLITYTNGEVGEAFVSVYNFSPPHCRISVPDQPIFALTSSLSIEGWINPAGAGGNAGVILWRGDCRGGYDPYFFQMNPDNTLGFTIEDASSAGTAVNTFTPLASNRWWHVAATLDGNTGAMSIYTNGVLAAQIFTAMRPFGALIPAQDPELGIGNVGTPCWDYVPFNGDLDEISLYSRALSASEVKLIYDAGSAGKFGTPSGPLYLDTDQDGIPDFWEITFGQPPYVPSNNTASTNAIGYTDLEEYDNWLAGPHALTITNTPVGVDLMKLFGKTGNLSFSVTNGINGFVYLTNVLNYTNVLGVVSAVTNTSPYSNSFAIFTPTNTNPVFSGYASFDVYVTNTDTVAWFGPVPVSVVVSAVPIAINSNMPPVIITLTNTIPYTNSNSGGSDFYKFTVTPNALGSNAIAVLFDVLNPSANVTLVARYGLPLPSLSSYDYLSANPGTANEHIVVAASSMPVALTNGDWYLAVVNVSGGPVTYAARATEFYTAVPPLFLYPTNGSSFEVIETTPFTVTCLATDTNTPPLPLTFALVSGPTNMTLNPATGLINWTPTEAQGPSTNSILVSVSNGPLSVTNGFTIIVDESNLPPVLPTIPNQVVIVPGTLALTNTATDPDIPPNPLTYALLVAPATAVIDTNFGIITWTPTLAQAGTNYLFTTVVTDTNQWAVNAKSLSATNSFYVTVLTGLIGGQPQTNTVPANSINWIAVTVPTNAIAATNLLLFATNLPVNVWFSTNVPPTTTNATDVDLMPNATNGVSVLTANSTPTNIVPGTVYFLGVQNPNSSAVTYALEVNFHLQLSVPAGGVVYYPVPVPSNADFATNILFFATGPLNVWFTTNSPPSVTNANDVRLLPDAAYPSGTNGSVVLSAGTTPPLVPGSTYYLGLQNTNSFGVGCDLEVDFHLMPPPGITNLTITATNIGGTNGFMLQWQGPANFQYEIQWTADLLPPLVWHTVLNPVINVVVTTTNGHFSFFDDGTLTGGFGPMKFYRVLGGLNLGPITGSGPTTNTVLAGSTSQAVVTVPANAISASNLLISATGPLNVWFNQTHPPTGNTSAGDRLMLSASTAGTFVLTTNSVPPLVPGTNYYLGFQNPGTSNVTFVFDVTFGFRPPTAPSISSITLTTNGFFQLQWTAPTNYQFQVEWTTSLQTSPIVWDYIPPGPPYITSTNVTFTFVDTNPAVQMKFYRLIQQYP